MKETCLMIGDWLMYAYVPYRVTQVSSVDAGLSGYSYMLENGDEDCGEPIPLTAEILEENGWQHKHPDSVKHQYWIMESEGGQVKAKKNRGYFYFSADGVAFQFGFFLPSFSGHIRYVHELQHVLRICGFKKNIEL